MTNNKTLALSIQINRPLDNIRPIFIDLPSGFEDINIERPEQRAALNAMAQAFGILFGYGGATLRHASILDTFSREAPDDCEECRFSGLIEED